jgi:hypothetical protein
MFQRLGSTVFTLAATLAAHRTSPANRQMFGRWSLQRFSIEGGQIPLFRVALVVALSSAPAAQATLQPCASASGLRLGSELPAARSAVMRSYISALLLLLGSVSIAGLGSQSPSTSLEFQ